MNRSTALTLLICTATLLLSVGRAEAQTTVNSAITKDTTLYYHDAPVVHDANFGGYTANDSHTDPTHYVLGFDHRDGSTHDNARPILKAGDIVTDLNNAGASSSSDITYAELHIVRVQDETSDRGGRAYRVTTGGWVEGDLVFDGWGFEDDAASWNSVSHDEVPWNTPGGDYDPTELGSFGTSSTDLEHTAYTVEITGAVRHWIDNPGENFGVILIQDVYYDSTTAFFAASDDTVNGGAYVPYISTQIVPEPGSMALILTGMAWMALCVRRRHAHRSSD